MSKGRRPQQEWKQERRCQLPGRGAVERVRQGWERQEEEIKVERMGL